MAFGQYNIFRLCKKENYKLLPFKNLLKIFAAQVLTLAIVLAIIETGGQVYAGFHPSYESLSAIPDPIVGWRLAPNLKYIHTGGHWYAREYSVDIVHNALGFRDLNRKKDKPSNTKRIALLGDSFVAANEVAFQNTPGQILEQLLNKTTTITKNRKFEVLNFGIGGTGIGQSFLTYRQYAQGFDADYVFLFVFEGDIWRTVGPLSAITNGLSKGSHKLQIRPIFNILTKDQSSTPDSLVEALNFVDFYQLLLKLKAQEMDFEKSHIPTEDEYEKLTNSLKERISNDKIAKLSKNLNELNLQLLLPTEKDYEEFKRLQTGRIETKFGEDRTIMKEREFFLKDLWEKMQSGVNELNGILKPELAMRKEFIKLIKKYAPKNEKNIFSGSQDLPNFEKVLFINLKILETLNRDIVNEKKKLIIVDASPHLVKYGKLPANLLSTILNKYCEINDIGYIPLYEPLNQSVQQGNKTTWNIDPHFNENGYRIFGEAMYRWIEKEVGS
jgi:hypothetical protein